MGHLRLQPARRHQHGRDHGGPGRPCRSAVRCARRHDERRGEAAVVRRAGLDRGRPGYSAESSTRLRARAARRAVGQGPRQAGRGLAPRLPSDRGPGGPADAARRPRRGGRAPAGGRRRAHERSRSDALPARRRRHRQDAPPGRAPPARDGARDLARGPLPFVRHRAALRAARPDAARLGGLRGGRAGAVGANEATSEARPPARVGAAERAPLPVAAALAEARPRGRGAHAQPRAGGACGRDPPRLPDVDGEPRTAGACRGGARGRPFRRSLDPRAGRGSPRARRPVAAADRGHVPARHRVRGLAPAHARARPTTRTGPPRSRSCR